MNTCRVHKCLEAGMDMEDTYATMGISDLTGRPLGEVIDILVRFSSLNKEQQLLAYEYAELAIAASLAAYGQETNNVNQAP